MALGPSGSCSADRGSGAPGVEYLREAGVVLARRAAVVPYATTFLTEVLLFGVVITTLPLLLAAGVVGILGTAGALLLRSQ